MRLSKGFVAVAAAAAVVLGLSACTDSSAPAVDVETPADFAEGSTMARLADAGEITIGTKFDQPLFGLANPDGVPEGFDAEIGKLVAAKLGIEADKITWVETVSANREPFIQNGQVDLVIATYTINDDRKKVVSFAGPYYTAGQDLLVLDGNPEGIESADDLAGKKVCTVSGSTSEKNVAEYTTDILATDTYSNCLEPLRTGAVSAVTTDNVILAGLADQNEGEFEVVGETFTEEPYGIGLALDDTDFRMFVNDTLQDAEDDGTWDELWEKTAGKVLDTPTPPTIDRY
ncbi:MULTISPECIES: glutamate ABC transporter substrate-binding protein [Frigoribacterium]|jgi:glutamate transport system substrate-binding protein|uniref:glutamate ABC transporter substrate-binding protein n=1 Tax=Frigoribacterium TaxID=96492 RepID=UPI0006F712AA|nr:MULTISPECIES: glutamate ABC transporter substrate-binding protein [Frigoribacterium]KQM24013.1 ABC transporter substrate-binding protein [Frigoribacterium sp. Leaf8]MBD8139779.1 glutamate ABC transporter substrate-binding protein [Frigoribacterium sp. CFBP 13605]MBD8484007.1 glutamate ABC transporter substrate-binding protein [Frigoribacterium sp. CFBP 8759]ROS50018.1 amino acid ABC transporter substrate-binding protein (PAAT family) [Frigoribacterium sp. PhB118]WAC53092.1 glutamate ABC tra